MLMKESFEKNRLNYTQKSALRDHLATFATDHRNALIERFGRERTRYVTVVLEDIFQPHNASAAIRSCECFGVQDIHIIENRFAYRINPDVIMGAGKWVNLIRYKDPDSNNTTRCLETLKSKGYRLAATVPDKDALPLAQTPLDQKIALMFGTEEEGLSHEALDWADLRITIPMSGFTQSFNLSVSVSLCLYDVCARLRAGNEDWRLSSQQRLDVELDWLLGSVKNADLICRRFLKRMQDRQH